MSGANDRSEQDVWYPIRASALRISIDARALDRRLLDAMDLRQHLEQLRGFAETALLRSIELLDHVVSTCGLTSGRRPTSSLSFELALDSAVRTGFDVGDLADFVRVEFRRRRSTLSRVAEMPVLLALAECDRAVAGVGKALSALELAAARASSTPLLRDFVFELDRSLRVRRAYASVSELIVLSLAGGAPPSGLPLVSQAIDDLLASELYAELRVGDRLLLRAVRHRLPSWSRLGPDVREELGLVVATLGRVSARQELVEHDSRVLLGWLEQPRAGAPSEGPAPPASALGPSAKAREQRREGDEEPTARLPPGRVRDVLDEYLLSHCAAWIDEGSPVLGGRTPRAAVETSAGRQAVEGLIRDMERQLAGERASEAYAFQWLRLELGLVPREASRG